MWNLYSIIVLGSKPRIFFNRSEMRKREDWSPELSRFQMESMFTFGRTASATPTMSGSLNASPMDARRRSCQNLPVTPDPFFTLMIQQPPVG